ncbi:hypothetical protein ACHAWF_016364 [Thalassiosira exigua]
MAMAETTAAAPPSASSGKTHRPRRRGPRCGKKGEKAPSDGGGGGKSDGAGATAEADGGGGEPRAGPGDDRRRGRGTSSRKKGPSDAVGEPRDDGAPPKEGGPTKARNEQNGDGRRSASASGNSGNGKRNNGRRRGKRGSNGGPENDATVGAEQPRRVRDNSAKAESDGAVGERANRRPPRGGGGDRGGRDGGGRGSRKARTKKVQRPSHAPLSACLERYAASDPALVRGKLRVAPARNGAAFVACDRGSRRKDVVVADERDRNRALDGDLVFVELLPEEEGAGGEGVGAERDTRRGGGGATVADYVAGCVAGLQLNDGKESLTSTVGEGESGDVEGEEGAEMWHDDEVQMRLWDPAVNLRKRSSVSSQGGRSDRSSSETQRKGRVIHILPPKAGAGEQPSELNPGKGRSCGEQKAPRRTIVGTLTRLPNQGDRGGRYLLVPTNKSLPRFMCPTSAKPDGGDDAADSATLYRAEYVHGSWRSTDRWPPCARVSRLCGSCTVSDETTALLVEHGVDHCEFSPAVLRDVEEAVRSGRFYDRGEMGWKPSEAMRRGRRDYRDRRMFTIDPTTAKDLDDAVHIERLPDGRVEVGVHIADVSHFVRPGSAVDAEALKRATTVYLVNDVIPMLPRPLCEVACSLNEDVERLAFSCVWRMNEDGTLAKKKGGREDVWYGRSVIKSCARLDYATAQNIIDGKVAFGERAVDETLWQQSRQPTGGHTLDEVAGDVRLMHKVAMARRKLRFENGALALNGVKLSFQLEEDGETPKLCAPYPIRDSNRLIEEYMLIANYLVAQRLITHAHGRALLRNHSPPIEQGLQQVVDVSKESFDFSIDTTNSATLQESLSRLSRECDDELVVQCVTESLVTPMRPAEYVAAGELDEAEWQHFALNIPYYTHFTSPIRRYPDVIVHRLLQATLDDEVDDFPLDQKEIHSAASHCNDMRMSAKKAQERSDRVFLSLYLKEHPISSVLGVCLGVGEKTFTVFVPSLGMSTRVFLQEHEDEFNINAYVDAGGKRRIVISPKSNPMPGMEPVAGEATGTSWKSLDIRVFTKLDVACTCKMQPPIDVRVKVVGPWSK